MEKYIEVLSAILKELGINPNVLGQDIEFLYFSSCYGGLWFKGHAQVVEEMASIELWHRLTPRHNTDEITLKQRISVINNDPTMLDMGERWMRFVYNQEHLGFVAQLNKDGKPFIEEMFRSRVSQMVDLIEKELFCLLAK